MKSSGKLLQWISAEMFFIVSVISTVMFGVFSNSIANDMHLSTNLLGWLSGTFFITYSVGQFYSGRLFVILPARWILFCSAMVAASGAFIFARSEHLVWLFISRGLLGIGLATSFVGVIFVVQQNFSAKSFPMMSSLSQSTANLVAGVFGLVVVMIHNYHLSFIFLACGLILSALLIVIFIPMKKIELAAPSQQLSLYASCKILLKNPQLWYASFFFTGLFSAVLTFSDLFNVDFQMKVFHQSFAAATHINAMIPFGLTIGGLIAGIWAQKTNDYRTPARVLSFIAVIMFASIMFIRFNSSYAYYFACGIGFLFGIGCSGSILAFQSVQRSVADITLRPLATSIVLTFACIFSGVIEQPTVGNFISTTELKLRMPQVSNHWLSLFDYQQADIWHKFNNGLYFILVCIIISFIMSFLFKLTPAKTHD